MDEERPRKLGESGYPPNLQVLVDGVIDAKDSPAAGSGSAPRAARSVRCRRELSPTPDLGLSSYASAWDDPRPEMTCSTFTRVQKVFPDGLPYTEW